MGARYCRVVDRRFAHLYYADGERHLSLHVIPGWLSLDRVQRGSKWGRAVVLMRTEGAVVGLTSEDPRAVDAFVAGAVVAVRVGSGAGASCPVDPLAGRWYDFVSVLVPVGL